MGKGERAVVASRSFGSNASNIAKRSDRATRARIFKDPSARARRVRRDARSGRDSRRYFRKDGRSSLESPRNPLGVKSAFLLRHSHFRAPPGNAATTRNARVPAGPPARRGPRSPRVIASARRRDWRWVAEDAASLPARRGTFRRGRLAHLQAEVAADSVN